MTNYRKVVFDGTRLASLRAPTLAECQAEGPKYKAKNVFTGRHKVVLMNEISPAELFCYLAARFSQPTGFFSHIPREQFKEAISWHYLLYLPEGPVDVLSLNFRTEVYLPSCYECSGVDLADVIKVDMANHKVAMESVQAQTTKWVSFLNPYAQLVESSQLMLERARSLAAILQADMDAPVGPPETARFVGAFNAHYPIAMELSGLCLSIRMMCPVTIEAFLNLVLYALAKTELRSAPCGLAALTRERLIDKVKFLHQNCDHFLRPVDWSSPVCQEFDALRRRRNDMLHGNVDPLGQKYETFWLWGSAPLFTQVLGPYERALGSKMSAHPLPEVEKDFRLVEAFEEYVLSCMQPEVAEQVRNILGSIDLAYDQDRDKLGILFANQHHDVQLDGVQ
jgi:hypothetical protein